MTNTINRLKLTNQYVKIYYALNEESLIGTENEHLWRDTLKQLSLAAMDTKENLSEITLVKSNWGQVFSLTVKLRHYVV